MKLSPINSMSVWLWPFRIGFRTTVGLLGANELAKYLNSTKKNNKYLNQIRICSNHVWI